MVGVIRNVVVLYNTNPAALLSGLKPNDFLVKEFEGPIMLADDDANALATVFHQFNHNPGLKRSLSVGDVVAIDKVGYACIAIGWTLLFGEIRQGNYVQVFDSKPVMIEQRERGVVLRNYRGKRVMGTTTPDFQGESDNDESPE